MLLSLAPLPGETVFISEVVRACERCVWGSIYGVVLGYRAEDLILAAKKKRELQYVVLRWNARSRGFGPLGSLWWARRGKTASRDCLLWKRGRSWGLGGGVAPVADTLLGWLAVPTCPKAVVSAFCGESGWPGGRGRRVLGRGVSFSFG